MELLFASQNQGKLSEVRKILQDLKVICLKDLGDDSEVEETGNTFRENAYLKAKHFYEKYGKPVFADDSGLVVPALNGEPGVRSARYADEHGNYAKNNLLLLEKMQEVKDRSAYFLTVVCFIDESGEVHFFEGRLDGEIAREPKGRNGFGYDPLFYMPEYGMTLAEMEPELKNRISHRYKALHLLSEHLKERSEHKMEKQVIADVQRIMKTENVHVLERLMGGMSNYTYVVSVNSKKYTYRIPGEYGEVFVDRHQELENIRKAESLGITNRTVYFNLKEGTKLAEYVEGKPLSTIQDYPYPQVAELLRKIHNSGLEAASDYQPFQRLKSYELLLKELGFVHSFRYLKTRANFNQYQEYLESQKKVFTHGDSQPSNFIYDGERLFVVDFEFTGNNDPIYDIACFANIRYEEGFKLLQVYYGNPNDDEIRRFNLWRCFQCLQWYNVAMFKEQKGLSRTLHIDFMKVAEHYLELAEWLLEKVQG